jgi:hypothetical protein
MNTYDLSDPYGVEESQIANRRRLAEMLMQQGMTGPAYSGKAAVAKALTQLFAGSQIKDAEKEQRGLAERKEQGRKAEMDTLFEFINQKPAQGPGMPQMDDEGNPLPGNMDQTAAKRMELARTMLGSRNPQLQQFALQSMMPKAGKLERVDLGDRIGLMDEAGNVVKEIPKGVGPDTRYSRETVGADTKFTHSTPSATAVLGDERTRAEGAANRGVTVRGQNMADERAKDVYDPAQIFGQQPGAAKRGPTAGTVVDGFRFKGGDPNDRSSWEPA